MYQENNIIKVKCVKFLIWMEDIFIEIIRNILENMMVYVERKKTMMDMENAHGNEEELYEDADYNFHKGCCKTAKSWMKRNRC